MSSIPVRPDHHFHQWVPAGVIQPHRSQYDSHWIAAARIAFGCWCGAVMVREVPFKDDLVHEFTPAEVPA